MKRLNFQFKLGKLLFWTISIPALSFFLSCQNLPSTANIDPDQTLLNFIAEEDAFLDKLLPQRAAERGEFNIEEMNQWNDLSDENYDLIVNLHKKRLEKLAAFDTAELREEMLTQYAILKFESELEMERSKFRTFENAFSANYFSSVPADLEGWMHNKHRVANELEARAYIERLEKIPILFRQVKKNVTSSKSRGIVSSSDELNAAIQKYRSIAESMLKERSTLNQDIVEKFQFQDTSVQNELKKQAIQVLKDSVAWAYQDLADFLEKDIFPASEAKLGLWQYGAEGLQYYRFLLKAHTSLDLSPEQIIAMGEEAVMLYKCRIDQIKDELGHQSDSLPALFDKYRRKDCLSSTEIKLLMEDAANKMHPRWEELFDIEIPEVEIAFDPFESFAREELDFSVQPPKPIFYLNENAPECLYTKWDMLELLTHEGVPGHGLEQLYTASLASLPKFRKNFQVNAFSEGWALYAEYLAKEIGFYSDLEEEFGRLSSSLFRACRLVVDASIHTGKMTKESALDYLYRHSPYINFKLDGQVLRYASYPAQATCYYIGANEIWNLRHEAEKQLMNDFDIRRFHAAVLQNGNLPLPLLKKKVTEWIAAERQNAKSNHNITFRTLDKIEGKEFLRTEDDFTNNLSEFDLRGRLRSAAKVSKEQYFEHVSDAVQPFAAEEEVLLHGLLNDILRPINQLSISVPNNEIVIIKTSGAEEGRKAYTRRNAVILPQNYFSSNMQRCESHREKEKRIQRTLVHEIWHIISRYNPQLKLKMYEIIGFSSCKVTLPADLRGRMVTNPDGVDCNYCFKAEVGDNYLEVAPVLFANEEYDRQPGDRKEFFCYIQSMVTDFDQCQLQLIPSLLDIQHNRILSVEKTNNYNSNTFGTDYLIHPDEICAEHFEIIMLENPPYSHHLTEKIARKIYSNNW